MRESDLSTVLRQLGKRSFAAELADWVHGTADLPVLDLLAAAGAKVHRDKAPLAQTLGLRVATDGGALTVKNVLRGGAGEAAGLAAGDEWLGVEFAPAKRGQPPEAWRVRKLDEVAALRGTRSALTALVARDGRLLRCPLTWPADDTAVRLTVDDATRLGHWLTRGTTS